MLKHPRQPAAVGPQSVRLPGRRGQGGARRLPLAVRHLEDDVQVAGRGARGRQRHRHDHVAALPVLQRADLAGKEDREIGHFARVGETFSRYAFYLFRSGVTLS